MLLQMVLPLPDLGEWEEQQPWSSEEVEGYRATKKKNMSVGYQVTLGMDIYGWGWGCLEQMAD